jgi:predicted amidohydrolase
MILAAAQIAAVPGDVAANMAEHLRYAAVAAAHGVQLLVFPELSLTGYELGLARQCTPAPDSETLDGLRRQARAAGMTIVAGVPLRSESGGWNIGAIIVPPLGPVSTYTKIHVHASERGVFEPGHGGPDLIAGEIPVALAICADASQPQHAADAAARRAGIYAVGAMIEESAYERKAALLEGYARRHRMAVLLANYSGESGGERSAGGSGFWSEEGRLMAAAPDAAPSLIVAGQNAGGWSAFLVPM